MVMDFHSTNYFGENIVIVGTGDVIHDELVDLSEKHFGHLKRLADKKIMGKGKAEFHPGLLCVRDENIDVSNVGVFYDAPSWTHPDFYGFLMLQRMFGEYEDALQGSSVMDVSKQHNSMHALLTDLPEINRQECLYSPYSDSGIFGNYFVGENAFTRQMNMCGMSLPAIYGEHISETEVHRCRNALYT
jgi:predicted Zn-dependent peptidase